MRSLLGGGSGNSLWRLILTAKNEVDFFFFNEFIYLFIYLWLHWVFIAARGLSLVAASGGFSCCGARAIGTRASVVVARRLSGCGSWALERRPSSCGTRA